MYGPSLCVLAAKALMRLCRYKSSHEPWFLGDVISIEIICMLVLPVFVVLGVST